MRIRWESVGLFLLLVAMPLRADEPKKEGKTYQIPYRLTNTKHVLVRAKINGKGPYNFIVDTGAPALFVSTQLCKKLGIEADNKGWGTFDRFEIEGGLVIEKARGRVEDPFQLEGMNSLGLAGAELHGIIGYNLLARYKMEFDFTRDKLAWTELNFDPKAPEGLGGKGAAGVDIMAAIVKMLTMFLGDRPKPEVVTRGFLGIELAEEKGDKGGLIVKSVLEKGPAAEAGVKPGDRITHYSAWEVPTIAELRKRLDKRAPNEEVTLKIERGGDRKEITLKLGEGL